jgi:hypothetical protein
MLVFRRAIWDDLDEGSTARATRFSHRAHRIRKQSRVIHTVFYFLWSVRCREIFLPPPLPPHIYNARRSCIRNVFCTRWDFGRTFVFVFELEYSIMLTLDCTGDVGVTARSPRSVPGIPGDVNGREQRRDIRAAFAQAGQNPHGDA